MQVDQVLDFQAYVSQLPVNAHSYLSKQLDWEHGGVDKDLNEIANHLLHWEEKISVQLGLTGTDIYDIKNIHQNKPILQRYNYIKSLQNIASTCKLYNCFQTRGIEEVEGQAWPCSYLWESDEGVCGGWTHTVC